jgi:hypothetical protein
MINEHNFVTDKILNISLHTQPEVATMVRSYTISRNSMFYRLSILGVGRRVRAGLMETLKGHEHPQDFEKLGFSRCFRIFFGGRHTRSISRMFYKGSTRRRLHCGNIEPIGLHLSRNSMCHPLSSSIDINMVWVVFGEWVWGKPSWLCSFNWPRHHFCSYDNTRRLF